MTRLSLFGRRPLALLLMLLLSSACGRKDGADDIAVEPEITLYHGGTIITMEAAQPQAEAVVTGAEGRILFVGDWADAFKAYPAARAFDLQGRTLMPGFIEQLLHPLLGALTLPVIAPEPWELPERSWSAVDRLGPQVADPVDVALSRDAALRAITIEAAYSWRMEDDLGSLKPGKIANFTILEQNPYQVPLDQLKAMPVYATVFEGRWLPLEP